jgi:branched-chain amino acid transport system ATP-binding protein
MNEPALLRVDKLEVVYHRTITAVQGISLAAEAGNIVAILGTNGAGKSTTLRAISGFLGIDDARVTDGSLTFKGRRIENRPPHEITRLGVVLVPERDKVFPNLTVAENLAAPFAPSAQRRSASEEFVYHSFPRLADFATAPLVSSPAASGRCWRSAAHWFAARSFFWSMNYRSASHRPLSKS